ncbi:MAG: hypothetical protein V1866_00860 [archaeon]
MELGIPRKKRKDEPGQRPDGDESHGMFGELDVDPDSELPVHEQFTDNKKLRKIRK